MKERKKREIVGYMWSSKLEITQQRPCKCFPQVFSLLVDNENSAEVGGRQSYAGNYFM